MKILKKATEDIKPYEKNPRKNQPVDKVAKSIKEFGFNQPIIVDKDNVIIAGHTRWKAAQKLGLETVPVVEVKLSKEKAKMYRIIDNKLSEEAIWDKFLLEMEINDLPMDDWDFEFTDNSQDIIDEINIERETNGIQATDQQKKLTFLYSDPTKYAKHFEQIQSIKYEYGFDTDEQIVEYLLRRAHERN
jgi:ParB family chromosome partitioning protein